jgi:hypothetical protein
VIFFVPGLLLGGRCQAGAAIFLLTMALLEYMKKYSCAMVAIDNKQSATEKLLNNLLLLLNMLMKIVGS